MLIALVPMVVFVAIFGYRYLQARAVSEKIDSIAVLPFENRSGSTDADYLSDGLTDSLIFRFSQLPNLKVSPTSSVMRYKGSMTDVADIAKALDVNAVLSHRAEHASADPGMALHVLTDQGNDRQVAFNLQGFHFL